MTRIISPPSLTGYSKTTQDRALDRMLERMIDLPALRDCLAATEACAAKDFDANKWPRNGIGWYCFARPNDTLRLDRSETGYVPTIGALKNWDAISYRFGLSAAQTRHLFDAETMFDIDGGEKTCGVWARLKFAERLADFIATCEGVEL